MNSISIVCLLVVLIVATVGQECPKSKGNLSDLMKLGKDFVAIFKDVCEKTNNVVPDAFVNETTNCFEQHIKPCLKLKAPIIMDVMKDCVEDKKLIGGDKFCDKKTQDEVMTCGKKWFESSKGKLVKAFTPNMGLISEKGKLFKNCINDNSMKCLDTKQ